MCTVYFSDSTAFRLVSCALSIYNKQSIHQILHSKTPVGLGHYISSSSPSSPPPPSPPSSVTLASPSWSRSCQSSISRSRASTLLPLYRFDCKVLWWIGENKTYVCEPRVRGAGKEVRGVNELVDATGISWITRKIWNRRETGCFRLPL